MINAAGLWAPRIAAMAGLYFPTTPVDHQHIALKAVPGHEFNAETPCLRDPDNLVYMRQEQGGLVIGGYEPNPLERWIDGVPWEHGGDTLPSDMDRFEQLLEGAIRRLPFLDQAGIITLVCHPGAYTPDCQPILSRPMAGVPNMWMAAGFSLNGYGGAGGVGKLMAEWIIGGEPTMDVYCLQGHAFWKLLLRSRLCRRADAREREILLSLAFPQRRARMGKAASPQSRSLSFAGAGRGLRREIWLGAC